MFRSLCVSVSLYTVLAASLLSASAHGTTRAASQPRHASAVQQHQTAPKPLPTHLKNRKDGAEMVLVPAGPFLMGDGDQSDNPRHTVRLSAYDIDKAPSPSPCTAASATRPDAPCPPTPPWDWQDDTPIVNVSWNDARAYCDLNTLYVTNGLCNTDAGRTTGIGCRRIPGCSDCGTGYWAAH